MDAKTLSYHNRVNDWTQMYLLAADGNIYKNSKLVTYLPPQKLQQIETWRKGVTQNLKSKSAFPRLNTPRADQIKNRTTSARIFRTETPKEKRIWSASSGKSLYRNQGYVYSETDLFAVRNHVNDTSRHYAAQREELYSANTQHKRSIKIDDKQVLGGGKENTTINVSATEQTTDKQHVVNGLNSVGEAEEDEENCSENLDIQTDDGSGSDLSSISRMAGRGTMICVNDENMIQVRSQSNHLLNVISIDDCKRTDYNVYRNARLKVERKRQMYQNGETEHQSEAGTEHAESVKDIPVSEKNKTESECSKRFGRSTTQASSKSVAESRNQIKGRTAKISKAIDEMVHERKVMNNMDRNFDARIDPTGGRLTLDRGEGGATFRRLNSALKRHINNVVLFQGQRNLYGYGRNNGSVNGDVKDSEYSYYGYTPRHSEKVSTERVRFYENSREVGENGPTINELFTQTENIQTSENNGNSELVDCIPEVKDDQTEVTSLHDIKEVD